MKAIVHFLGVFSCIAVFSGAAEAAVFTGTYSTPGPGNQTTGSGPWQLTSTDATFSLLRFTTNENPDFADVTNLNVVFNSPLQNALETQSLLNAGGGGGAPRLSVALDSNGDNVADKSFLIHLGTPPSYIDTPTSLNLWSGVNLINNDPGRYDLTGSGGSSTTNYAAAVALAGTWNVLRMSVILDSFGGADKTLEVTSINGEFVAEQATVPEPASLLLWSAMGLVAGGRMLRRRRMA
jgi:hypothetical protein